MMNKKIRCLALAFLVMTSCSSDASQDPHDVGNEDEKNNEENMSPCEDPNYTLSCPENSVEVPRCDNHPNCETFALCGQTISCETCDLGVEKIEWHSIASVCPKNYFPLDRCDSGDVQRPCLEFESACGLIYCNPIPIVTCFAPECEEGFIKVERCRFGDESCKEPVECRTTASCIPDQPCEESASCAEDEIRYESLQACELEGRPCRQTYSCNDIAWCGANDSCSIPKCGDKKSVLECVDVQTCSEEYGCGQIALCEQ